MSRTEEPTGILVPLLTLGAVIALAVAGFSRGFWVANAHNGLLALAFGGIGAWLLLRRPWHGEGLLFAVTGVSEGVLFLGRQVGHTGTSTADRWWGWLGVWPLALILALTTWTVLCFPEGRFLSRRWRWFGLAVAVIAAACSLVSALWPVEYDAAGLSRHPLTLGGADVADRVWSAIAHPAYALFQLSWLAVVLARWRSANGILRRQLAVMAVAVGVAVAALIVGLAIWHSPRAGLLATPLVPLAAGWVMERIGLGGPVEESRAAGGLDSLSARENEVLDLIAQGLSNQAICERLHLSIKTVEPVVSSIFTKLDLHADSAANRRVLAVLAYLGQSP
ncbi:helix-turn-helix transcriptional regulator [Nocardioides sp. Kera G14]|uniref:helix-turn-helix transcriptional regulator n=1 Tax=Nocardioides sp. Kera G14 TaxID=2884264 RepID=UPI001D128E3C|nr:helix-turn-helix transcriptional regulator [Nocardioides sp. Kera G14]UDY22898.1 helix-turn-helix transcriptional regulator [Nocardioides sp. Kera G14]